MFKSIFKYWRIIFKKHLIIYIVFGIFSSWLMFFTFGYDQGNFLIKSNLWSDFAAHIPMIRSFSLGHNYPVQYPQFANEPIRYHFIFYLMVGLLEKLGLNLALALNLLSSLGFFGLLVMIFKITKVLLNAENSLLHKYSWIAGLLAVFLFLFNSSLTFVDYFQESGISLRSLLLVFQQDKFINFGPWNGDSISAFWNWNVYTNQRHLAFSLALGLMIIWPVIKAVFGKKSQQISSWHEFNKIYWVFIAISMMVMPFLNTATYLMIIMFILIWLVLEPNLLKPYRLIYGSSLLLSFPSFFYFLALGGDSIRLNLGFLAEEKTLLGIIYYWWRNIGLALIMWPVLFIIGDDKQKKLWLVFSSFFILANLFQLSTDLINNHKLINFFQLWLGVLLAVKIIRYWFTGKLAKIFICFLVLFLTFSGFLDAMAVINDRQIVVSDAKNQAIGLWILDNTAGNATFLTSSYLYNPASIVGRATYLDYGYFAWSMGYYDKQRRENLTRVFSSDINLDNWCQLLQHEKIDYILISAQQNDLNIELGQSWLLTTQPPSYQSPDNYLIFKISQICSNTT